MSYLYYGIIIIYPLIAALVAKITLSDIGVFHAIKEAYRLFLGFFLAYGAALFILLGLVRFFPAPIYSFLAFSLGYFAVFVVRTYIYAEQHDLFKPSASAKA